MIYVFRAVKWFLWLLFFEKRNAFFILLEVVKHFECEFKWIQGSMNVLMDRDIILRIEGTVQQGFPTSF